MRDNHFRPDATFQKAISVSVELLSDCNFLRSEVLKCCPMPLVFLNVPYVYLIDKFVFTFGRNAGLCGVSFVWPNIVFIQSRQNSFHAGLDFSRLIARTVAGKQKLQHECGDVRAFFDTMKQVLPNDLAVERIVEFPIEGVHLHFKLHNRSPNRCWRRPSS